MEIVAQEMLEANHIRQLSIALQKSSIPFLIFKGSALAYQLYSDPTKRPRADTDVLIKYSDLSAVESILKKNNFIAIENNSSFLLHGQKSYMIQPTSQYTSYFDIHWHLFSPVALRSIFSFEELWQHKKWVPEIQANCPNELYATIICVLHWIAHHFHHPEKIWLTDLQSLTKNKSEEWWTQLFSISDEKEVTLLLEASLKKADIAIPTMPYKKKSCRFKYLLIKDRTWFKDLIFDLKHLPYNQKFQYLKQHLFPEKSFINNKYNNPKRIYLFYLLRIIKGLGKLPKQLRP